MSVSAYFHRLSTHSPAYFFRLFARLFFFLAPSRLGYCFRGFIVGCGSLRSHPISCRVQRLQELLYFGSALTQVCGHCSLGEFPFRVVDGWSVLFLFTSFLLTLSPLLRLYQQLLIFFFLHPIPQSRRGKMISPIVFASTHDNYFGTRGWSFVQLH